MRFGISSVFPFRPHVEQMEYLARLLESAGHETRFLVCDASLSSCYNRLLKKSKGAVTCATCVAGGLRSYRSRHVSSFNVRDTFPLDDERAIGLGRSSVISLHRLEDREQVSSQNVRADLESLAQPMRVAYGSAREWIRREKLDGVLLFNGRMDATRAVLEAARDLGVGVVTVERPWFGHGLNLVPNESCLGLSEYHRIVSEFDHMPLTSVQARRAARQIAARYGYGTLPDWRVFHAESKPHRWPTSGRGPRILILPSSRGEVQFDPSWEFHYASDMAAGFDAILKALGASADNVVLRAHPIWAQKIGRYDGSSPLTYYREFAVRSGFHWIGPDEKVLTTSLMDQADVVVTGGGASALEAAALGKAVVSLGPAVYSSSSAVLAIMGPEDLRKIEASLRRSPEERVAHCLRALYSIECRVPQYVLHVRSLTPTKYAYFEGADVKRLLSIFERGRVEPDDAAAASGPEEERKVISRILERRWDDFESDEFVAPGADMKVGRRWMWSWLDRAREWRPPGDRL